MKDFNYVAPPTIAKFMRSDAPVRILAGPIASGKTVGCLAEILRRCSEAPVRSDGKRKSRWAIISPSWITVHAAAGYQLLDWLSELGTFDRSRGVFRLQFSDVSADIFLIGLDTRNEVLRFSSIELTGAYLPSLRNITTDILQTCIYRVGRFQNHEKYLSQWSGIICEAYEKDLGLPNLVEFVSEAEVFIQPPAFSPQAENVENLSPGYYDRVKLGKSSDWINTYLGEEPHSPS